MTNKQTIVVVGLIGAFVTCFVLVVYGSYRDSSARLETYMSEASKKEAPVVREDVKVIPSPKPTPPPRSNNAITKGKEAWMEGCLESGDTSYASCSCAFDFLLNKYGMDGLLELATDWTSDSPTDAGQRALVEAVVYCSTIE